MPAPDELYPPAQYGGGWMLLAFGILLLLALGVWLVILFTRPRSTAPAPTTTPPQGFSGDIPSQLRVEYLDRVQRIEDDYLAGTLSARNANFELSRVVRTFVNEYSGLEAPVMTLEALRARGVQKSLIEAVQLHYYPSVFHRGPAVDPIAGAKAARAVMYTWH